MFGASNLVRYSKISPLFIGLSIISIGNSMPELCITIISGIKQVPELAVGTLVGSNIAHVSLVLGIAAIIKPFKINAALQKSDIFIFFSTSLIATLLLLNNELTPLKGIILLATFILAFTWIIIKEIKNIKNKNFVANIYIELPANKINLNFSNILISILWLIFGIITLHISSYFVIESAQQIAKIFALTNLSVGLLLLGIGTNLPELAIMIASIYNNERDLALGGVLGANIFGITFALGLSGILFPVKLPYIFRLRDLSSMMFITTIYSLFLLSPKKLISRFQGAVLIALYLIYIISIFSKFKGKSLIR
ncbi:MAG: sodium:calcium antiporter [Gammaproteobacteria bacterium]